jgi:molecular chaperone GrpE
MTPIGRPHDPAGFGATPPRGAPAPPAGEQNSQAPRRPEPPAQAQEPEVLIDPEAPDAPAENVSDAGDGLEPSVEDLVEELEAVILQRDEYLELARAKQADFENFRKQAAKRQFELTEQAAAGLVKALLPVLDALDNGVGHGDESLVPVRSQLLGVLEKEGLVRVDPVDDAFDPNEHDAVAHEPGEGGEASVAETLRAGYRWNGRLLRPAMVRVRG